MGGTVERLADIALMASAKHFCIYNFISLEELLTSTSDEHDRLADIILVVQVAFD